MDRRRFIKKASVATAGSILFPTILPSGTLFAQTGSPMADHIVYVLFAGGVRQQEAVLQRYLTDSQGLQGSGYEGNIMYNLLDGAPPQNKIVYGTDPAVGLRGSQPIPPILSQTIQSQGTLFPEVKAAGVGHYSGLVTLLTGSSLINQGLRQRPIYPTIFEYARRHLGYKASDVWFVGNGIGNSTPLLNYSIHPDFGSKYGSNFLAPTVVFGQNGEKHIKNAKAYHPEEELGPVYEMENFLNDAFNMETGDILGVENTEEEKHNIKEFKREMFNKKQAGTLAMPPVADLNDSQIVGYTCEVLKWFKPKITVLNMNNIDGCHSDFTGYLRAMHRCDHAIGHLWNYIQTNIPEMAGNTFMMVTPEHGRNLEPNTILDENDWFAYDHSDQNSTRIFNMIAGPGVDPGLTVGSESNPKGDITDGLLTLAEVMGIKNEVMSHGLVSGNARSLFDRI